MKLMSSLVGAVAALALAGVAAAQCGSGGSCYETHGPGCNDADCCNAVCALDPFCCNNSWDSICVSEANQNCAVCGGSGAGSCFETGSPFCNDADCCNAVCAADPFCCATSWDSLCVDGAYDLCATCGGAGAGSCFTPGATYCNDADCCNAVCAADSFCCSVSWDSICVDEAFAICATCGGAGAGSCFTPGATYCNDADCCNAVCAADPFCCSNSWDSLCVSEAGTLCATCGGSGSGSCFTPGAAYCNDSYCCNTVCASDPFCCSTSWDSICVGEAYAMCTCGGEDTHSCFSAGGPYCNDADCCNAVCAVDSFCCNVSWDSVCVGEAGPICASCGGAGSGSCYSEGATYCNDAACCNTVCSSDPFCCNTEWDSLCVSEALNMCSYCGSPATHSCFSTGGPFCDDANCCNTVCAADPFCCSNSWDGICVNEANSLCAAPCPADLNGNGNVGPQDLALLLGAWGTPAADLNGDGITGPADLALLLGAWGPC